MELDLFQVDAFARTVFEGNPAAVVPLEGWLDEGLMQKIAMENNLAETAYFVRQGARYGLRWFTPETEIDLCGHATLATAYTIFRFFEPEAKRLEFETRSGVLAVERKGEMLEMDFPARPPERVAPCAGLLEALGGEAKEVWASRDYMVVYGSEAEVRALEPALGGLKKLDRFAVIVTAPSSTEGIDFVSRFFAPAHGVDEDPVTGSAHSTLVPFWAERLGKKVLTARQVSRRGGTLYCEHRGERVSMAGTGVLYMRGRIEV
jgi:predicted PhzF superfamily epimerase YddE/YHI9